MPFVFTEGIFFGINYRKNLELKSILFDDTLQFFTVIFSNGQELRLAFLNDFNHIAHHSADLFKIYDIGPVYSHKIRSR